MIFGFKELESRSILLSHPVDVIKVFKKHLLAGDEEESVMSPFSRQPFLLGMTLAEGLMCVPLAPFSW